jgi:hypothetical protein
VETFLLAVSQAEVMQQLWPDRKFWIGLSVFLVIGGAVLWWIRGMWREDRANWGDGDDDDAIRREMLIQFRESEREGVLSAEEYRLIKSRLVRQPVAESERRDSTVTAVDSGNGVAAPNASPTEGAQKTIDDGPSTVKTP